MANVNKVILVGRLSQDVDLKYTPSGNAVANMSIATNKKWKDNQGVPQEKTEFHRIVCWGKLAELCNSYLAKGREVYLEGELETRQWNDKDGNKRYTTEINANTVQFLGGIANDVKSSSNQPESKGGYTADSIPF